ncbi:MAG: hypothetical protein KDI92_08185 [Xanthomonadales bacterium]|nr:hypothetical protein [Xanthomonadales bacterium]
MNEMLIYLGISLLSILLFAFGFSKQGKTAEKKWLMEQLATADQNSQQRILESLQKLEQQPTGVANMTLLAALLIIPTTFLIDYVWFHDIPIEQRVTIAGNPEVPDLATAIKQLEQKLVENPDDLQGQLLYGQAMMSINNYADAVKAYKKANQIDPNNSDILTELAEAIAFRNNTGSFLGEPEQYLTQALTINPTKQKTMWLQGIVYYEKQLYQQAEDIWTDLLATVENPNIKSTITKQINQARAGLNKPPIDTDLGTQVLFNIVIEADETIKTLDINEPAKLFVFAKDPNGSSMPIAATAISAPFSWPITIELSDQNSLNPETKLSQFEQLEISAKISMTGNASNTTQDIVTESQIVNQGVQTIQLTFTQTNVQ